MRTFIGGLAAGFVGWLVWLFTRKAPHRTVPNRPAFMWHYEDEDWYKVTRKGKRARG